MSATSITPWAAFHLCVLAPIKWTHSTHTCSCTHLHTCRHPHLQRCTCMHAEMYTKSKMHMHTCSIFILFIYSNKKQNQTDIIPAQTPLLSVCICVCLEFNPNSIASHELAEHPRMTSMQMPTTSLP